MTYCASFAQAGVASKAKRQTVPLKGFVVILLRRILLISICLAASPVVSEERTTRLDCNVLLNSGAIEPQFILHPDGARQPMALGGTNIPVQFDLVIEDWGNNRLSFYGGSSLGASIGFHAHHIRHKIVRDDSSSSEYRLIYEVYSPDGTVFSKNQFSINRYSGAIEIEGRVGALWGKSRGRCKVISSKAF